ncbi:MAG: glycosyltransferase family 39 protein [Candidatus Omnitrophica bacterium]|jgi:hypothetical protein|nr:glycosyltransferase family 39 protein [Candidatus Omnitrophota bacterium]
MSGIKTLNKNGRYLRISLYCILILAGILRYLNISSGLDLKDYEMSLTWAKIDEETTLNCLFGTLFRGDLNPHNFIYPSLYRYFLFLIFYLFFLPKAILTRSGVLALLQVQAMQNPSMFFLISRYVSAAFGVATIYILYRLVKKISNSRIAFISSLFLALSPLHIRESHFGTIDATLTFMMLLSLFFILKIYLKSRLKDYLLSGLLIGLAISIKYNAFVLVLPLLVAHFLQRKAGLGLLGYGFLAILFSFLIGTPFSILAPFEFFGDIKIQISSLFPEGILANIGFLFRYKLLSWLFIGILIGIFLAFNKKNYPWVILYVYYFSYYVLTLANKGFFGRYLLPFVSIFYALGTWILYSGLERIFRRNTFIVILILALLAIVPFLQSIYHWHRALSFQDSRQEFLRWVSDNNFTDKKVFYLTSSQLASRAKKDSQLGVCFWDVISSSDKKLASLNKKLFLQRIIINLKNIITSKDSNYEYYVVSAEVALEQSSYRNLLAVLLRHCDLIYELNFESIRRNDKELFLFLPFDAYSRNQKAGPHIAVFKKCL